MLLSRLFLNAVVILGVSSPALIVTGCGGSDDADTSVESDTAIRNSISGQVIDESGLSVANVTIRTVPQTGQAITDSSGSYSLTDTAIGNGKETNYTVYAERAGYTSSNAAISLGAGTDNIANFTIIRSVNGLVAQDGHGVGISTLVIGKDESSTSFVLSSTTPNNTFQFSSNKDWLTVSPVSGQIDEKTRKFITVTADKSGLSDGEYNAIILGNGNTQDGIFLNIAVGNNVVVVVDKENDSGVGGEGPIIPIVIEEEKNVLATTEIEEFTIVLEECSRSGNDLKCKMKITRTGQPTKLWIGCGFFGSKLIDSNGDEYISDAASLGSDSESSIGSGTTCGRASTEFSATGLTKNASIKFNNVPDTATQAQLVEIDFIYGGGTFTGTKFKAQFVNITLPSE